MAHSTVCLAAKWLSQPPEPWPQKSSSLTDIPTYSSYVAIHTQLAHHYIHELFPFSFCYFLSLRGFLQSTT